VHQVSWWHNQSSQARQKKYPKPPWFIISKKYSRLNGCEKFGKIFQISIDDILKWQYSIRFNFHAMKPIRRPHSRAFANGKVPDLFELLSSGMVEKIQWQGVVC